MHTRTPGGALSIGIDIGGTNIKGALFDVESGACLDKKTTPTRDGEQVDGVPAWAAGARDLVNEFEDQSRQKNLPAGVSAPGLAARDGTSISFMPGRMSGLEDFNWPAFLNRNVRVLNDAH